MTNDHDIIFGILALLSAEMLFGGDISELRRNSAGKFKFLLAGSISVHEI
jgi:hypothetical protein